MAIDFAVKRMIGKQLVEWVFLGVRTGARRAVENYEQLKVTDPVKAIQSLKRAIDMANRARARIDYAISLYGAVRLTECVEAFGDITVNEINTELDNLEAYFSNLFDRRNGGESWDSLALDITNNIEKELTQWEFPFPPGYTDIWGE